MSTVAQHLLLDDIYFAAACKVLIILSNMFVGNLLIPQLFRYSKNTRALHGCIHAYTHVHAERHQLPYPRNDNEKKKNKQEL